MLGKLNKNHEKETITKGSGFLAETQDPLF